ncbi:hypothetical protein [Algoriphagus formosus]|uniref:hypothetical protein n=1 Tax=Algoriphagus formosus TaxID=2007308 RepID=UPI003F71986C
MDDLRKLSKKAYSRKNENTASYEEIQTGCLQRIANSLEKIEQPYQKLISDYEYLKVVNARLRDSNEKLLNQLRAYKGHITRLKRKEANNA